MHRKTEVPGRAADHVLRPLPMKAAADLLMNSILISLLRTNIKSLSGQALLYLRLDVLMQRIVDR